MSGDIGQEVKSSPDTVSDTTLTDWIVAGANPISLATFSTGFQRLWNAEVQGKSPSERTALVGELSPGGPALNALFSYRDQSKDPLAYFENIYTPDNYRLANGKNQQVTNWISRSKSAGLPNLATTNINNIIPNIVIVDDWKAASDDLFNAAASTDNATFKDKVAAAKSSNASANQAAKDKLLEEAKAVRLLVDIESQRMADLTKRATKLNDTGLQNKAMALDIAMINTSVKLQEVEKEIAALTVNDSSFASDQAAARQKLSLQETAILGVTAEVNQLDTDVKAAEATNTPPPPKQPPKVVVTAPPADAAITVPQHQASACIGKDSNTTAKKVLETKGVDFDKSLHVVSYTDQVWFAIIKKDETLNFGRPNIEKTVRKLFQHLSPEVRTAIVNLCVAETESLENPHYIEYLSYYKQNIAGKAVPYSSKHLMTTDTVRLVRV